MEQSAFFEIGEVKSRAQAGKRYLEFLRLPAMSAGLYVLPAGATDMQSPHNEDELYYVIRGRGRMRAGDDDRAVQEGSVILVLAGVQHKFHSIEEELAMLVFFAPAES